MQKIFSYINYDGKEYYRIISSLNNPYKINQKIKEKNIPSNKAVEKTDIDIILAYVDSTDPVWIKEISKYPGFYEPQRFRSFGTLKYLLRLIDKNFSWINKIHLVVSSKSQVPEFVNQDKVHIVEHRDIIPEKYLPTFNILLIEFFFHKIKGLSNRFIYFNDDMFPLKQNLPEMFFLNNVPCLDMIPREKILSSFGRIILNNESLLYSILNKPLHTNYIRYIQPRHSALPHLKSTYELIWKIAGEKLNNSFTKFREYCNYNQWLFLQYHFYNHNYIPTVYNFNYCEFNKPIKDILDIIKNREYNIFCLNDNNLDNDKYRDYSKLICEEFDKIVPEKCQYEI